MRAGSSELRAGSRNSDSDALPAPAPRSLRWRIPVMDGEIRGRRGGGHRARHRGRQPGAARRRRKRPALAAAQRAAEALAALPDIIAPFPGGVCRSREQSRLTAKPISSPRPTKPTAPRSARGRLATGRRGRLCLRNCHQRGRSGCRRPGDAERRSKRRRARAYWQSVPAVSAANWAHTISDCMICLRVIDRAWYRRCERDAIVRSRRGLLDYSIRRRLRWWSRIPRSS